LLKSTASRARQCSGPSSASKPTDSSFFRLEERRALLHPLFTEWIRRR